MGKGDKKTKRGKIIQGSYGVTRPKRKFTAVVKPVAVKVKEPVIEKEVMEEVKPKPKAKAVKKTKTE